MKYIFAICVFLIMAPAIHSQKKFIRIFDETGRKTYKGYLSDVSDSTVTIRRSEKIIEIPITKIATIKLNRSVGHTVLVSSLVGATSFAILGIVTADPDAWIFGYTAAEGAVAGAAFGGLTGSGFGSIISALSNRPAYHVNMNHEDWMKVKPSLIVYLTGRPMNERINYQTSSHN
jgi:hypothetical protein